MNYYQLWQLKTFGNILPSTPEDVFENIEENLRLAEFMEAAAERQRLEDEN